MRTAYSVPAIPGMENYPDLKAQYETAAMNELRKYSSGRCDDCDLSAITIRFRERLRHLRERDSRLPQRKV
jgi:hypothetical protein